MQLDDMERYRARLEGRRQDPTGLTVASRHHLPVKQFPMNGEQVIIDGDDWRGQLVVKLSDVARVLRATLER